ncbi:ankyrin repeat domain-containing protein [Paenibacillus silvisoli]|uniref:ankyrin repeat domain-containing protein n=1 Tax=Paenibacillus silvisoli TaxID=3110539 RepID=UPI0028042A65|nr:ankyrin repeat domain-containing protein [Paenibacillus silvisoli]
MNVYRTGPFAELAGVTTRTLRYYDRIGLLKPTDMSEAGQRLYTDNDLERLQQIITLKFIGFSLEQIKGMLELQTMNAASMLAMQREWMEEKIGHLQRVVNAIKGAERVAGQERDGYADNLRTIIGVIEMEANKDWLEEFLSAAVGGNEDKASAILAADKEIPRKSIYAAAALGDAESVRLMLQEDAALAVKPGGPENGEPLLYLTFSCFLGNPQYTEGFIQTARLLISHGANVNASHPQKNDPHGRQLSCLYGAVGQAGNAAVGRVLLEAGADPNDGESLYHAAEWPSHACLSLLFEFGADANVTPALMRKLDFEDYFGVKLFLENGTDPNLTLGTLGPPLYWAIFRGRSASVIELLIQYGADVNRAGADGKTIYQMAVRYGRGDVAELLRAHGAAAGADRMDELFGAYAAANEAAVRELLRQEPGLLAAMSHKDRLMLLEFAEMNKAESVHVMLETGMDGTVRKGPGTALHFAAWFGHIETVRVLLAHGASLTATNAYGGMPLNSAVHGSLHCPTSRKGAHAAIVEALIKAGAAVPETASGSKDVFEVLRRYGASA